MEQKLEIEIFDLKHAYDRMIEALNDLADIEDFADDSYKELNTIAEEINDLRIEKEAELERLQDEEYFEEQKEQWEKEQREQEREYWNSVL